MKSKEEIMKILQIDEDYLFEDCDLTWDAMISNVQFISDQQLNQYKIKLLKGIDIELPICGRDYVILKKLIDTIQP